MLTFQSAGDTGSLSSSAAQAAAASQKQIAAVSNTAARTQPEVSGSAAHTTIQSATASIILLTHLLMETAAPFQDC